MGGPSGNSGGGGNSNKTRFGYDKPPSTIEKVGNFIKGGGIVGSVVRGIKEGARKSKANVMDYEGQAAGVTPERAPRDPRTGNGGDNNNNQVAKKNTQKSIEQPKVKAQMDNTEVKSDLITADETAPTSVEMTDDERLVANKRGRKTKTVLTSITGDNSKVSLSKRTLLGG